MTTARDAAITYFHRGVVEVWVPSRRSYVWQPGYSENGEHGPCVPWMTKRLCRADAKQRGAKAVFSERNS